jgi:hypothetical protein
MDARHIACLLPAITACTFDMPVSSLSTLHTGRVVTASGDPVEVPERYSAELELREEDGRWMAPPGDAPATAVLVPHEDVRNARAWGYDDLELELRTPLRGRRAGGVLWIQADGDRWIGLPEHAVEHVEVTDQVARRNGTIVTVVGSLLGGALVAAGAIALINGAQSSP